MAQGKKGKVSARTHIQGSDQKMLQGNAVFNNIENKKELIELAANFFKLQKEGN